MPIPNQHPSYWEEACASLSSTDPIMARLIEAYPGEMLQNRHDPFQTLARAIVGQQISVQAADAIWGRLDQQLSGKILPAIFLEQKENELRLLGLSRSKISYLQGIAHQFLEKKVVPEQWYTMEKEAILKELLALRGVGTWTAEMFLIFHLHHPDVWPLADIGLLKAIDFHYFEKEKQSRQHYLLLGEQWRPWRTVATWYLWRSLDPVPVAY